MVFITASIQFLILLMKMTHYVSARFLNSVSYFRIVLLKTFSENVAIGKTCGISSTWRKSDNCSAAINGNNRDLDYPGNCIHTGNNDNSPFWWLDLRNKFTISTMIIYGRTNCEML